VKLISRTSIVGAEVVGVGAFVLLLLWLEGRAADWSGPTVSFGWGWGIVGATLILVGLETFWLGARVETETQPR
jgi:hypothetical protein